MTKLTLRTAVPEGEIARLESMSALPGEAITAQPRKGAVVPEGMLGRTLVVREAFVDAAPKGEGLVIHYAFEGFEGEHLWVDYDIAEPMVHTYGFILTRDGQPYVAAKEVMRTGKEGSACFPLVTTLTRGVIYNVAGPDPSKFFSELDARPAEGEFVVADLGDGTYRLEGVPWWSDADAKQVTEAEEIVAAHLATREAAPAP